MKKRHAYLVAMLAGLIVTATASGGPNTGITATPAATVHWAGTYSATFVRSASGIINETNRLNSAGAQNGWTSADVYLQFRPQTNPFGSVVPNPTCDPEGLVTPMFTYSNSDPALIGTSTSGYFLNGVVYNVCVYLVNPVVATGTVDSAVRAGTTASLPSGLNGHFRIGVNGTWTNDSHGLVDAEYVEQGALTNDWQQGWPGLGASFGDLMVNNSFVDWGSFNVGHAYSYTLSTSGSVTLNMFDGDATNEGSPVYMPSWYADNTGTLNYTITYLGL
jgi:hypothetical protein